MSETKILVVGGVAGGASTAARARRLGEHGKIILFDRGPYVSFANCGLPYFVGDVIREEKDLILASPELFHDRFRIEVRTLSEVKAIDREAREIVVHDLEEDRTYRESYTHLVLSPGARAIVPPVVGVDLPGVFSLRTIPDSRSIRAWIEGHSPRRAVIVGGGFIGLEMAENLAHRGIEVTLVDLADQVMPPIDPEMAAPVAEHLENQGVRLALSQALTAIERDGDARLRVTTSSGARYPADLVLLAIGVRPETELARAAGLAIHERGGILVDEQMRTSDPHVFAVGDAVTVTDFVTGGDVLVPLAGPAHRQGRIAANTIFGKESRFRGVQGTAVCGVFDLTVAMTGASAKSLLRAGRTDWESVYLHPGHHVAYYPGARPIHLKVLFQKEDGRILGAQAFGEQEVARRIDVIAMAIQMGATVFDLEEAELCYAPQFGAAKDPVNLAGMIAANALRGDHPVAHWPDLAEANQPFVLDVREPSEFEAGHWPGAHLIPLGSLRDRLGEVPKDRDVWVYCAAGQRAYYATRALTQHGLRVRNLSGGFTTRGAFEAAERFRLRKGEERSSTS